MSWRRESLGREGETRTQKPFVATLQVSAVKGTFNVDSSEFTQSLKDYGFSYIYKYSGCPLDSVLRAGNGSSSTTSTQVIPSPWCPGSESHPA
jgi:hypothetical protein